MKNITIVKNYLFNVGFQMLNIILPLITTPYISRILGAENIGIYSYTLSIATYFTLLATFGFHIYGQRQVAYCRNDKYEVSIIFWEVTVKKFLMVSIAVFLYLLLSLNMKQEYKIYVPVYCMLIVAVFFDISWFFQGLENFKIIFVRNLVVRIAVTICIFLFVKGKSDLGIYIFCNCIATLISNLTFWLALKKEITVIKLSDISLKRNNKMILELFIPILAVYIYSLVDKTMLGVFATKAETGYYEQSQKIVKMAETVLSSLGAVLIPRMSNFFSEKNMAEFRDIFRKSLLYIIFLGVPLAVGLSVISTDFVPLFFGEGYEKVVLLLKISIPIIPIVGVGAIAGNGVLIPSNRQNMATLATGIGAGINVLLNWILIPYYASIGAMIASIIAELCVCSLQLFFCRDYFEFKWFFKSCFQCFVVTAVSLGLAYAIVHCFNYEGIISSVFILVIALVVYMTIIFIYLKRKKVLIR